MNGLVMFVYSCLLIQLNRGHAAARDRPDGRTTRWRIAWAVLFYGFFSVILLWDQAKQLFGF